MTHSVLVQRLAVPALLATIALTLPAQSFVVANRGSGDITVHRAWNGALQRTVPLPAAANPAQPMYVVQVRGEVLVGDRGNNRVVRFDKDDYTPLGEIAVGAGVFHMWFNGHQLWVNNDIANTTSVIDTHSWQVVQTVPIPPDLASMGYHPHDVFVGDQFAWVSLVGGSGATDFVVQTRISTYQEVGRIAVGKDPHLWWDRASDRLYVPAQNGNSVDVLNASTLARIETEAQPGAHGVFLPAWTRTLLVTNLPGLGADDLVAYRTRSTGIEPVATVSTERPTAHNIAALPFGLRIAVTHSGPAARKVTLYRLRGLGWFGTPALERLGEVDAGVNPFGLAVVY